MISSCAKHVLNAATDLDRYIKHGNDFHIKSAAIELTFIASAFEKDFEEQDLVDFEIYYALGKHLNPKMQLVNELFDLIEKQELLIRRVMTTNMVKESPKLEEMKIFLLDLHRIILAEEARTMHRNTGN